MVITFFCLIIFSFILDISGAADSYTIISDSRKMCEDFGFTITFTDAVECNDGAKTAAPGYTWVDWGTTNPDDPEIGCILFLGYGVSVLAKPGNPGGLNYYTPVCKIPDGTSPALDCTPGLDPVNNPCTCNAYDDDGTTLRASVTCNKGQVCNPALVTTKESIIRLCEAPSCGNTDGITDNDKACTCGDVSVVTTEGEFSSRRQTCEPEQYCTDNLCISFPLCQWTDGITQNTDADCYCNEGELCNPANGRYCRFGVCTLIPVCQKTDGNEPNGADCSCNGGETCNAANGKYCLALPSTPGFCRSYPSTFSYYIKESGTCGVDIIAEDNLKMCQHLSEQSIVGLNNPETPFTKSSWSGQPDGCQNSEDWAWEINFYDNSACSSTFKCICQDSSNPIVRKYCPVQSGKNSELCTCGTRHLDAPTCQEDEYCYGASAICETSDGLRLDTVEKTENTCVHTLK